MNNLIPVTSHYIQVISTAVEIHGACYGFFFNRFGGGNFIFNDKDFFCKHCFSVGIFLDTLLGGRTLLGYYVGILHCFRFDFFGTVAIVFFKEKHKCAGYSGCADSHGGVNPPPVASRGADGRFIRLMHA